MKFWRSVTALFLGWALWASHPIRETLGSVKEDHDDYEDEYPHIEWPPIEWPPNPPPVFPSYHGWEQAANVAVQARYSRLRGYAHLIDPVFSPELILQ